MADNSVFISGIAPGALEQALNDMPAWATESAARDIEKLLGKILGVQTQALSKLIGKSGGKGNIDPATIKELESELDKLLKLQKKEYDQQTKKYNEDEKENKKLKKRRAEEDADYRSMTTVVGGVTAAYTVIKGVLVEGFNAYTKINEAGVSLVGGLQNVTTGFDGLSEVSRLTGIRYTELESTLIKFNTAVNAFTIGKFANTVKSASSGLTAFGYSSKESAELLGTYLEAQAGFTDIRGKSEEQVSANLIGFGKRISDVSLATGQMRSKILENLDAMAKSTDALLLAGQVGADQSGRLQEFAASFKNKELGTEIFNLMADPIKALNPMYQAMQKSGGGAIAQAEAELAQRIKLSNMTAEQAKKAYADFAKEHSVEINRNMQQNALLKTQDAQTANRHYAALFQEANTFTDINDADKQKIEATNQARAEFSTAWDKLTSSFQVIFTPILDLLKYFATGLTWVANGIGFVIDTVKKLDGIGIPLGTILLSLVTAVGIAVVAMTGFSLSMKGISKMLLSSFAPKKAKGWTTSLGADGSGGPVRPQAD